MRKRLLEERLIASFGETINEEKHENKASVRQILSLKETDGTLRPEDKAFKATCGIQN